MNIKSLLKNIFKLVVTIALMAVLLNKINIEDFKNAAGAVNWKVMFVSIFIYLISVELNAVKWKILLPNLSICQLSKTCFKAQFYSVVLPGQLFGEASKVLDLKQSDEAREKVVSSVIIDKITSLVGTMLVGCIGLVFTGAGVSSTLRGVFATVLLILVAILWGCKVQSFSEAIIRAIYFLWKTPNLKLKRIARKTYQLYASWKYYSNKEMMLLKSVLVGIGNQGIGSLMIWIISNSIGLDIGFTEYCWIMPAISIILLLPISFGGLGVREVSLSGFLTLFGASVADALVLSVSLLLSQIIAAIIGAVIIGYDWLNKC